MRIAVIDGQGGGIGCALIEKLKDKGHTLTALGTNSQATSAMLRAGADEGATGENAISFTAAHVDIITGPVGILAANSLLGEVSPRIAAAVAQADALKVLVPSNRCNILLAGTGNMTLSQYAQEAAALILARCEKS